MHAGRRKCRPRTIGTGAASAGHRIGLDLQPNKGLCTRFVFGQVSSGNSTRRKFESGSHQSRQRNTRPRLTNLKAPSASPPVPSSDMGHLSKRRLLDAAAGTSGRFPAGRNRPNEGLLTAERHLNMTAFTERLLGAACHRYRALARCATASLLNSSVNRFCDDIRASPWLPKLPSKASKNLGGPQSLASSCGDTER